MKWLPVVIGVGLLAALMAIIWMLGTGPVRVPVPHLVGMVAILGTLAIFVGRSYIDAASRSDRHGTTWRTRAGRLAHPTMAVVWLVAGWLNWPNPWWVSACVVALAVHVAFGIYNWKGRLKRRPSED